MPKCPHLQHLLEISASISCPPHKVDPLFRPLGTLQTHFDSALPCSNPLPSAGQAGVPCSDLSGLSCLSLPPPPPAQPHGCHVAIRLFRVRRARDQEGTGDTPPSSALSHCSTQDCRPGGPPVTRSLSSCPSSCMPTRCLPQDAIGVAMGWGPEGRGPSLHHSYSCHPLLQPGHTGGSFQISSRSPFAMVNIPFPLKQSFAKLAGARGNLARSCRAST